MRTIQAADITDAVRDLCIRANCVMNDGLLDALRQARDDEAALLDAALAARPRKVVIKRPLKGPYLGGVKPDYELHGKAVRYDCIVIVRDS